MKNTESYIVKAYQVLKTGQPAVINEIVRPVPGKAEVLLEIAACGLNFADLLMQAGTYQQTPDTPFTLGMELAGTVVECGDNVTTLSPGDRVAVFSGSGGLAEFGCFAEKQCTQLPETMPFQVAAAFQVAYGTSHLALHHRARITSDDTVLVLGASGGVGLTAIEIAKLAGASVIAVARGKNKLKIARAAGADHLIDSETGDLRAQVLALGGASVVYDPVGGSQFNSALRACKPEARVITIGFASGDVPQIPANIILVKNITVIGMYWGGYLSFNAQAMTDSLQALFNLYADGKLRPHISKVFQLDQAREALEMLQSRKSTGKSRGYATACIAWG